MRVEVLTIGDELLDGLVADGNTLTISNALAPLGLRVDRRTTLRDDAAVLVPALRAIAERADVCVTSGGLGPTPDDLTVECIAAAAGVKRVEDAESWRRIQARYGDRPIPPNNRRQALIPEGAVALLTEVGTAPAVRATIGGCTFYALPGVPRELAWHLERHVVPHLKTRTDRPQEVFRRAVRFVGVGESAIAHAVGGLTLPDPVQVSWRTRPTENQVLVRSTDPEAVVTAAERIAAVMPDAFVGFDGVGLIEALLECARANGLTVGAAESCTGGLVGGALTDVPGASDVFSGSIVAYANPVKEAVLGVSAETLAEHGAVSEPCARAMAEGARRAIGCDAAVSITGIAGPGGGSAAKPVGTVWFGWSGPWGTDAERMLFRGDRERVRRRSVVHALDGLRRRIVEGAS